MLLGPHSWEGWGGGNGPIVAQVGVSRDGKPPPSVPCPALGAMPRSQRRPTSLGRPPTGSLALVYQSPAGGGRKGSAVRPGIARLPRSLGVGAAAP